jgi:thiol-disulfide isomerase/thioredoxin
MKCNVLVICILLCVSCKDQIGGNTAISEGAEISESRTPEIVVEQNVVSVVDYNGLAPILNKKNDTIYVVNFWATWCKPCVKELPAFEQLGIAYKDKKVKVILVSLDFPEKLTSQVLPFLESNEIASEVILLDDADANSWIPKISEEWSGAIPATIVYKNEIRTFYERSFSYQELETELISIL